MGYAYVIAAGVVLLIGCIAGLKAPSLITEPQPNMRRAAAEYALVLGGITAWLYTEWPSLALVTGTAAFCGLAAFVWLGTLGEDEEDDDDMFGGDEGDDGPDDDSDPGLPPTDWDAFDHARERWSRQPALV